MNLKQAYQTLELPEGTSPEDAKKKYRALSKKWHPDINKDDDAEQKFKKINEAYQCIQNGQGNDKPSHPFVKHQVISHQHVEINMTIDFKDAVLGCKKDIKYSRLSKCASCDGSGQMHVNNGCSQCKGKGQIVNHQGGMVMISTCPKCHGKVNITSCQPCKGDGTVNSEVSVNVSVPPGIVNGNTLCLKNMGNYAGTIMGIMEQYTDTMCHIKVNPYENLTIEGQSVISHLKLSLLDALKGCSRQVKTIFGDQQINIKPQSRHNEEVIIPKHGVAGTGDQKVILNVEYPNNVDNLINLLSQEV